MSNFQTLSVQHDQKTIRITLNRPDAANGINLAMAKELLQVAILCEQSPALRAVLITANGKMFSAGGDVKAFAEAGDRAATEIRELMVYLHAAIAQFDRLAAPVIIAVNGMAAGAGFSLACAGDIVLAAETARFTMAYTAIGLSPDGGATWHLPRLVGMRRAQELMLTNRRLTAAEALDWGIVSRVVADDALATEADTLLGLLADGPTCAYAAVKRLLNTSLQNGLETQLELEAQSMAALVNSHDGKIGISSFVNKQKPEFTGQ